MNKVTVTIPVYNARSQIERCLEAVRQQNVLDVSILVVDNASDDGTFEFVTELLAGVEGAKVVRNSSNLGRIENWNRCIELSNTRYVKFALVNDVLLPGSLQCLLDAADLADDTVMVCSRFKTVQDIPDLLPEVNEHPTALVRSSQETARFFATNGFRTGGLNGMLLNREIIMQRGLRFREEIPYCADYLLGIELAMMGSTVFIDTETYYFHAGSSERFHFAGLKDPRTFFLEQRECALLLSRIMSDGKTAFSYLDGQYQWFLGQGTPLKIADAWATFADAPLKYRVKSAWLTWRVNLNRAIGRETGNG